MNRFLSKLDLRDIKIDPQGASFPPDADDHEDEQPAEAPSAEHQYEQHSSAEASSPTNGGAPVAEPAVETEDEVPMVAEPSAPASIVSYSEYGAGALPEPYEEELPASDVLKVSARSRPSAVAGAIAGVVREMGRAEIQAIGAGATNQAVKAVAIARDYLRETDIDVVCLPEFIDIIIDDEERTAMLLVVEPR